MLLKITRGVTYNSYAAHTKQLQYDIKEMSSLTNLYVCIFFEGIGEFKTKDIGQRKPLIALELYETSKKILQYYPIYDTDISPLKDQYIATMLDPRLKKGIFRILKLPAAAAMTAEEYLYKVFHRYREEIEKEECVIKRRQGSTVENCNDDDLSFFQRVNFITKETTTRPMLGDTLQKNYPTRQHQSEIIIRN